VAFIGILFPTVVLARESNTHCSPVGWRHFEAFLVTFELNNTCSADWILQLWLLKTIAGVKGNLKSSLQENYPTIWGVFTKGNGTATAVATAWQSCVKPVNPQKILGNGVGDVYSFHIISNLTQLRSLEMSQEQRRTMQFLSLGQRRGREKSTSGKTWASTTTQDPHINEKDEARRS